MVWANCKERNARSWALGEGTNRNQIRKTEKGE